MTVTQKYPITLAERLELGLEEQYFEGTFDEFVQLADICDYPVEFHNGTIIAMSIASDKHEQIVANLLGIFYILFGDNPEFKRYGSNRHVFVEESNAAYSPDASMVKSEPDIFEYRRGKTANKNPWLVAEILSNSTRNRDYGEKLSNYKKMPSLQYILFLEQDTPLVTVYQRIENSERWRSTDFNEQTQNFDIADKQINLSDIYKNISFESAQ